MKKSETHDAITQKCTIRQKVVNAVGIKSPSQMMMRQYEKIGKAVQEGIKAGLSDTRLLSDYAFNKKVKEKIEGVSE